MGFDYLQLRKWGLTVIKDGLWFPSNAKMGLSGNQRWGLIPFNC
ncbi:hypothetical protein [Neobacillus vireti]